jgi:hypothetical protein
MISGCKNHVACKMPIGSRVSSRNRPFVASSVIPRYEFFACAAAKKNVLRSLWSKSSGLLRPEDPPDPRPLVWRHQGLPGSGGPAGLVPELPGRETGKTLLAGRQSVLHQTLCLPGRPPLPLLDHHRCGPRTGPRLEDGQRPGKALHARATSTCGNIRSEGHRHRRVRAAQGTYLPYRGQRFASGPADLVWRQRPLGEESRPLLSVAGTQENQANSSGRHGYVETVPQLHAQG